LLFLEPKNNDKTNNQFTLIYVPFLLKRKKFLEINVRFNMQY